MAIDNRGDIAGFIIPCPLADTWVGFVRDHQGEITTFAPIAHGSVPTGINQRGDITGVTSPYYPAQDGFVRDPKGVMTVFDAGGEGPGPKAHPVGINNRRNITGYFFDSESDTTRGFLRDAKGKITIVDAAGAAGEPCQPASTIRMKLSEMLAATTSCEIVKETSPCLTSRTVLGRMPSPSTTAVTSPGICLAQPDGRAALCALRIPKTRYKGAVFPILFEGTT
jgi:hypothetical protein